MNIERDAHTLLEQVPDWAAEAVVVREGANYLVVVTRDARHAAPTGGQFVFAVPAGRYMVETLDIDTATWVSRESAAGGPLVAGLVCPGSSIIVRIRPVD